jgi:tetratricopeptide (TPR) repeat protein
MQKLAALGYVASDASAGRDDKNLSGTDPKQKIEISNLLHDAMFNVEDALYQEAIPLLRKVLAEQPDMPVANMQYGMAQARLRNFADAIPAFEKAIKLLPDNSMGRYEFGLALFETGKWAEAAPQFEVLLRKLPAGPTHNFH